MRICFDFANFQIFLICKNRIFAKSALLKTILWWVYTLTVLQMRFDPIVNPLWHGGGRGIFLSPCPFWIRFCQQIFFQKSSNFFGNENRHQSSYFDTLPSSLSLLKVASVALKMSIFLLSKVMPKRVKVCTVCAKR